MEGHTHRIKRLHRLITNERGYVSLTEAASTVAIGLTLAAAMSPVIISVGDEARITRAKQDVVAITTAIDRFVKDVAEYPIRNTPGLSVPTPRTAAEATFPSLDPRAVPCLRSGLSPAQDPDMMLPAAASVCGVAFAGAASPGFFLNNHLVHDTYLLSQGNAALGLQIPVSLQYRTGGTTAATPPRNWNGPYIKEVQTDPWGRNYIVYAHGMNRSRFGVTGLQLYAWVLSAGPNGTIETLPTSPNVQGDDIGTLASVVNVPEENFRLSQRG